MGATEATAEVFLTAFGALPRKQQEVIVRRLLRDRQFREDLIDMAILDQRRREPSRPIEKYLAKRGRKTLS